MELDRKVFVLAPFGRSASFLIHGILLQQDWSIGPECCIDVKDLDYILESFDSEILYSTCKKHYSKNNSIWYYDLEQVFESDSIFPTLDYHEKCSCVKGGDVKIWTLHVHDIFMSVKAAKKFFKRFSSDSGKFNLLVTTRSFLNNVESCNTFNPYQAVPRFVSRLMWGTKLYGVHRQISKNRNLGFKLSYISIEDLHEFGYNYLESVISSIDKDSPLQIRKRDNYIFRGEIWRGGALSANPVGHENLSRLEKELPSGLTSSVLKLLNPEFSRMRLSTLLYWFLLLWLTLVLATVIIRLMIRSKIPCFVCCASDELGKDKLDRLRHKWHQSRRIIQYLSQL